MPRVSPWEGPALRAISKYILLYFLFFKKILKKYLLFLINETCGSFVVVGSL
jgi:hypothetical protein